MSLSISEVELLLSEYHEDIEFFAKEIFGITLRPKQTEFLKACKNNKKVTLRAGIGIGKTTACAILVFWGVFCFTDIKIVCVAPTEAQIDKALWAELERLYALIPIEWRNQIDLSRTTIKRINDPSVLVTKTIANDQNPEALRGIHATNVWVIADEASGIGDVSLETLTNIMTDPFPKFVMISNPTKTSGFFYRSHTDPAMSESWVKLHGSIRENPGITEAIIADMIAQNGGPLSRKSRIDIDGEFPLDSGDGIIPLGAINDAVQAKGVIPSPKYPIIWGVDVAGGGSSKADRTVLIKRHDNTVFAPVEWSSLDTAQVAERLRREWDLTPKSLRPKAVCIDTIGLGQGVYDNLKGHPMNPKSVKSSTRPIKDPEQHNKLRDEMWWSTREWFMDGGVSIPNVKDLIEELALPEWNVDNGKTKVESKDSLRKRSKKSPDYADALCLTFGVNPTQIANASNWNKPLTYRRTML